MLDALGNLGDFIGGIAVIVTLIYLAIQVRQNTKALSTASRQAISSGYQETNRQMFDNNIAMAFAKGLNGYSNLPFDERTLFGTYITDQALFFQGAFALYESGQLEEATYSAYLDWISSILATLGGSEWLENVGRPMFPDAMISAIDQRLQKGGLHDLTGLFRLDD
jgi:hypothetical protein